MRRRLSGPAVSWRFFKAIRAGLAVKRPYLSHTGRAYLILGAPLLAQFCREFLWVTNARCERPDLDRRSDLF